MKQIHNKSVLFTGIVAAYIGLQTLIGATEYFKLAHIEKTRGKTEAREEASRVSGHELSTLQKILYGGHQLGADLYQNQRAGS